VKTGADGNDVTKFSYDDKPAVDMLVLSWCILCSQLFQQPSSTHMQANCS